MDTTDLAILRELAHPHTFQWDVRISYAEVGRRVGVDEETVRARLRRLQEAGVITGWRAYVNPRALGRTAVHVGLRLPEEAAKDRVLPALRALDGATFLFDHHGPSLGLVLMAPPGPPLERQLAVLAALTGHAPEVAPVTFPPPTVEPGPRDWSIVQALRADARRAYAELAAQLGMSERTVRRRLERLTEGRVVYLMPRVDISRADGVVAASYQVFHRDPAQRGPADAFLRSLPGIVFQWYEGPSSRLSLARRNVPDLEALRREMVALPGVERVVMEITLRREEAGAWLDEELARRAQSQG